MNSYTLYRASGIKGDVEVSICRVGSRGWHVHAAHNPIDGRRELDVFGEDFADEGEAIAAYDEQVSNAKAWLEVAHLSPALTRARSTTLPA